MDKLLTVSEVKDMLPLGLEPAAPTTQIVVVSWDAIGQRVGGSNALAFYVGISWCVVAHLVYFLLEFSNTGSRRKFSASRTFLACSRLMPTMFTRILGPVAISPSVICET